MPQPKSPGKGYQFTEDMTDEAIAWTQNFRAAGDPPKSWMYFENSVWLPAPIGPQLFPITAEITIPKGGAEGVIA